MVVIQWKSTNHGKSNCVWIPFIGKELILDAEYRNEHDGHAIVGMSEGFVIRRIPVLSPRAIGIYRYHRCEPVHVYTERCHTLHYSPAFIQDLAFISIMAQITSGI